jgi:hypothetical protein
MYLLVYIKWYKNAPISDIQFKHRFMEPEIFIYLFILCQDRRRTMYILCKCKVKLIQIKN